MGARLKDSRTWLPAAVLASAALAVPEMARADVIGPACESPPALVLAAPELVELVLSTVLRRGVAVLLLGATAVVSLPWLVAGVFTAMFHVPRWLRAWL